MIGNRIFAIFSYLYNIILTLKLFLTLCANTKSPILKKAYQLLSNVEIYGSPVDEHKAVATLVVVTYEKRQSVNWFNFFSTLNVMAFY